METQFFQGPPTRVKNFKGLLFAPGPLTSVCERSLIPKGIQTRQKETKNI